MICKTYFDLFPLYNRINAVNKKKPQEIYKHESCYLLSIINAGLQGSPFAAIRRLFPRLQPLPAAGRCHPNHAHRPASRLPLPTPG